MKIIRSIAFFLFVYTFTLSCSESKNTKVNGEVEEEVVLIQDIQIAVDNYFSADDDDFLRSTFCGEYSEPIIGRVYEFVITKTDETLDEFSYLVKISYDTSSETINVIKKDFYALTDITDVNLWIDDRKKKNDAKKVH